MIGHLRRFWQARSKREQQFVVVLGSLLLAAAYAGLVLAAGTARSELSASLAALRNQAARLERDAGEIESLRQRAAVKPAAVDLRALAQAQAGAAGLTRALQRVDAPSANQLQVSFAAAAFADWLVWLNGMQAQQLRLESCHLEVLATQGLVSVTASLSRPVQQ